MGVDLLLRGLDSDAASKLCMVGPHAAKRHPEVSGWLAELDTPIKNFLSMHDRMCVPDAELVFPETYRWSWMRKYASGNTLDLGSKRGSIVLLEGVGRTTVFEVDKFVRESAKAAQLAEIVNRTTTREERKEECPKVSCTFSLCSENGEGPTRSVTLVRLVGTRPGNGTLKVDKSRLYMQSEQKPNEKAAEVNAWANINVPDPSISASLNFIASKSRLRELLRPLALPMVSAIKASAEQHKVVYDLWLADKLSGAQSKAVKGASLLKKRTDVNALATHHELYEAVLDQMVVPELAKAVDRYFKIAVPDGRVELSGAGSLHVVAGPDGAPAAVMDVPPGLRTCLALAAHAAFMDRRVAGYTYGLIALDSGEWKRGVPGEAYMRLLRAVVDADRTGRVAVIATDDPEMAQSSTIDERVKTVCVDDRGNVSMRF